MKLESMPRTSPVKKVNDDFSWGREWQLWLSQLFKKLNTITLKESPIYAGVTTSGTVDQTAEWLYDGTFVRIVITLTPSGGGTTTSAAGAYLALPFTAPFGIANVSNLTTNAPIGTCVVNGNRIYLPAWTSLTSIVRITAICGAEEV